MTDDNFCIVIYLFIYLLTYLLTASMEDKANGSVDIKRYHFQLV